MKFSNQKLIVAMLVGCLFVLAACFPLLDRHASAQSSVKDAQKAADDAQKASENANDEADKAKAEADKAPKSAADKAADEADQNAEKAEQAARDAQDRADASQAAKEAGTPNSSKQAADDKAAAEKARDEAQKAENAAKKADDKADKGKGANDKQKINRQKQREKRDKQQEAWEKKRELERLTKSLGLAFSSAPSGAQSFASTQLVGLVYDKDSRPGEQMSASLTTEPAKYKNIPGLAVIELKGLPSLNTATLDGLVIDPGDGNRQPASNPFTVPAPANATSIPVKVTSPEQGPTLPNVIANIPLTKSQSVTSVPDTGAASDFATPPVVLNTSVIHGPLSGDASQMSLLVDDRPASVVTATPRSLFFSLPPNLPPGAHTLLLRDGQRTVSFPISTMNLVMKADRLQLLRGQSTNYSATLQIGPWPSGQTASPQWGGFSPELNNLPNIMALSPGFQPPKPSEPGVIFLGVTNASRETISIRPSQNEAVTRTLHQQDFQNGQFTISGVIESKQSGGFVLNGLAEAFFPPIAGTQPTVIAGATQFKICDKGSCARQKSNGGFWCQNLSCTSPCSCHLVSYPDAKDKEGKDEGTPGKDDPFYPPKPAPGANPRIYMCSCIQ